LTVRHVDDDLVVVHKPPGHVVHRTPLCPDAPVVLQQLRDQLSRPLYPVHRLDRSTCGLLLFALTPRSASRLCQAFREQLVEKEYLAVVRGWTDMEGTVDHALAEGTGESPKEARTQYRRLATCELPIPVRPYPSSRYSLLSVRPLTGRTHQIRRHMKHIAHPVIGDTTHGRSEHNVMFRERFGIHRLLLQATRISFPHPRTQDRVTVADTVDPEIARLLAEIGLAPSAVSC
jgi:tRNA pseudouridine65 synthase